MNAAFPSGEIPDSVLAALMWGRTCIASQWQIRWGEPFSEKESGKFKRRIEFSNLILSVAWKPLQLPGHLCFFIVNRVGVWSLLISSGEPLLCSALIADAGRTGAIREASLQTQHAICSSVHWPASAISFSWTVLCDFHFSQVCVWACLCILVRTSRRWTGFIVRTFLLVCGPHNFIIQFWGEDLY